MESRNIGTSGNTLPFGNSETYRLEKFFMLYGAWANKIKISQDVPFNRFLTYTISYIIYLILLVLILIFPDSEITTSAYITLFGFYFSPWIVYDISMILIFKRKMFTRFWRVCSLLCHVFLVLSMIATKVFAKLVPSCSPHINETLDTSEENLAFQANQSKENDTEPPTTCVIALTMAKTMAVTLVLGIIV